MNVSSPGRIIYIYEPAHEKMGVVQFLAQMRFCTIKNHTSPKENKKNPDGISQTLDKDMAIYVEGGHTRFVMKIPVDAFYALALLQLESYTF